MKKMILTLAIAISTFSAFATEANVNDKVLNAFKTEFNTAQDVQWSVGTDYFKATFVYNDKHVFAYYSENGELLALTRYLSPNDLPISLQTNLKKNYNGYWITDLFEVAKNNGTTYYLTLENADTRMVVKSTDAATWSTHNKEKKS